MELNAWTSHSSSAFLRIHGSSLKPEISRDFAIDVIQLFQRTKFPIAWYLHDPDAEVATALPPTSIFCLLIRQAVDQHIDALTKSHLDDVLVRSGDSHQDWLQIFVQILREIPKITIVVDTKGQNAAEVIGMLRDLQQELSNQNVPTVLKIMVLTYADSDVDGASQHTSAKSSTVDDHLSLMTSRSMRGSRSKIGRGRRLNRRISRVMGPESLELALRKQLGNG
jgi:hypothetical protein